ncbi:MAG: TIGR03619 family F420-dependent LLM class oxidoreductase [bacterium]|nr:TIGR03619 family F420-dependent LLM class oxidoreductase [bacterium]
MRVWQSIAFAETEQLVDIAVAAEELGFTGLTTADHLVTPQAIEAPYPYSEDGSIWWDPNTDFPDVWMAAAVLAQHTTTLRFMPLVYIPPLREVFSVAKLISTAAVFSNNRVELGAGVGWMKDEFLLTGQDFHRRGRHTDEMLEVLRKFLTTNGMVSHSGEFYDFPPVQMEPVPTGPVPVLIGGVSKPALRRAARWDGWLGINFEIDELEQMVGQLNAARQEAGTADRDDYRIMMALNQAPTLGDVERLTELGVTDLNVVPWLFSHGLATSSIDFKRDTMAAIADSVISRL